MTYQEALAIVSALKDVFFLVRISDPETNEVWDINENGEFAPIDTCYRVWGKKCACEHCTTLKTCQKTMITDKYEIMNNDVFHVTSKPVDIDGHTFAFEIVSKLDDTEDIKRREILLEEQEKNVQIIKMLTVDFESVYHIDLQTKKLTITKISEDTKKHVGNIMENGVNFSLALGHYLETMVKNSDIVFLRNFADSNFIKQLLTNEPIYKHIYRVGTEEDFHYDEMKIVKANDGEEINSIVVGIVDRDKEIRARLEAERVKAEQKKALAQARAAAEAANKAKTSFLFNMSHDIRTPMNAIVGFNDMALKYIDDGVRVKDYLGKIRMSSDHLLSIINDVLDMARIESGKVNIEESVVDILQEANQLSDIVSQSAKEKNIKLVSDFTKIKNPYVYADKLRVNRVIMNIISNAIKYTDRNGHIEYKIIEDENINDKNHYRFIVKDNGIGMSEEFLEHIFETFSRDTTVNGIQGTGLGMAITKELVDLMDGDIDIQSKINEGTTVTIGFSFRPADPSLVETTNNITLNVDVLNGKKVLLVEDNALNREIANEILDDYGMKVDNVENGEEAVEFYKKSVENNKRYDFILMDVQMPIMDGYTATKLIRKINDPLNVHVPIIAMTANAFAEDKDNSIEAGMDDHLSKPIDIDRLLNTISRFLIK